MPQITPNTVADLIFWSYANLAMAHDGIKRGIPTYDKTSFIIRTRLYKGLQSGQFQIGTLFEDERWKMENGARCVYCGTTSVASSHPSWSCAAISNWYINTASSSASWINHGKKLTTAPFRLSSQKYP